MNIVMWERMTVYATFDIDKAKPVWIYKNKPAEKELAEYKKKLMDIIPIEVTPEQWSDLNRTICWSAQDVQNLVELIFAASFRHKRDEERYWC